MQQSWLALHRSNVDKDLVAWDGRQLGGEEKLIFGQELTSDQRSDLQ